MKIKFVKDYQGRETLNNEMKAGQEISASVEIGLELIRLGVAEEVEVVTAPPKPFKRKEKTDENT